MEVRVEVLPRGPPQTLEMDDGGTGLDLLEALGLQPEAHVLFRRGTPIPVDDPLADGDEVQVVLVVSGGGA